MREKKLVKNVSKKINEGLVLGALLFMGVGFTGCGTTTVDLNKYISIEADGYDSMGTVSYVFDSESFENDYSGKIKLNSESNGNATGIGLLTGETSTELLIDFCVDQSLDKTSNLSNGDVVTLTWDCDDELANEYFNCKLKYSDITYTVEDLTEVKKFNPFDYVEVSFTGISPNGDIEIIQDYEQSEMQYIKLTADKNSGLKAGDSVKIIAEVSGSVDTFVEKFGEVLGETEKTYEVEKLASYVVDVNDISSEVMEKMTKQGEDIFKSSVAKDWDEPENLKNISYIGNYFLTAKSDIEIGTKNYIYLVYKISAVNPEPEQEITFYYYVCFKDIVNETDGTISVDLNDYSAPTSGWFGTEQFQIGIYTYAGFENLDTLYNDCVVSKVENYEYTSNINE